MPPCGWETHLHMIPPHVSSVCAAPRSASPVFLRQIRRQLWQQCGGDFWSSPAGGLSAVRGDFLRRLAHTHPRPSPLLRMPLGAQTAHNNIGRGTGISCGLKRGAALPCRAPDIAAWIQSRTLFAAPVGAAPRPLYHTQPANAIPYLPIQSSQYRSNRIAQNIYFVQSRSSRSCSTTNLTYKYTTKKKKTTVFGRFCAG